MICSFDHCNGHDARGGWGLHKVAPSCPWALYKMRAVPDAMRSEAHVVVVADPQCGCSCLELCCGGVVRRGGGLLFAGNNRGWAGQHTPDDVARLTASVLRSSLPIDQRIHVAALGARG